MKKLLFLIIILPAIFACDDEMEQAPADLTYEVSFVELKKGKGFISESPEINGKGPFQFEIESISNNEGESFEEIPGINIESESGKIIIEEGNDIEIDTYQLNIKTSNDIASQVFEEIYQIAIIPLDIPRNLSYSDDEITLDFDEGYTSNAPEIDGIESFTFSLVNNEYDFISIDSSSGEISISNTEKLSGSYNLSIRVENEDGEATFEDALTFLVIGQFAGKEDGFYLYSDKDNFLSAILDQKIVEWDGFTVSEREGLHYSYIYLTEGQYSLIKIGSKGDLLNQYSGATDSEIISESYCNYEDYNTINELEENGDDFRIEDHGFYLVSYDETLSELFYYNIQKAGIIGSATEEGWAEEQDLTPTTNSSDIYFSNSNLQLREGEFKIRFNCSWSIDRRMDLSEPPSNTENGYIVPTNLGGKIGNLVPGSQNVNLSSNNFSEGVYEVKLFLNADNSFELELLRIADLPEVGFDPNEYQWAIVGAATSLGWPTENDCGVENQDIDFSYLGETDGAHRWELVDVYLTDQEFNFRANDCWEKIINPTNGTISGSASSNFGSSGGGNFKCYSESNYRITLSTNDEGENYLIEISEN